MLEPVAPDGPIAGRKHAIIVRVSHWLIVGAVLALTVSGFNILTSHPRLYWGETGNVRETPWLVLPIPASRRSVPTIYDFTLHDRNGWSRNVHFEAAWLLILTGAIYWLWGFASRHFSRDIVPRRGQRDWRAFSRITGKYFRYFARGELLGHADATDYNPLQRVTYAVVIFVLFPLIVISGLAMSPYITAAYPVLVEAFGGRQTARSCHFLLVSGLIGFVVIHVVMVKISGSGRLLRGMTIGSARDDKQNSAGEKRQ